MRARTGIDEIEVLLVVDDPRNSRRVRRALVEVRAGVFRITRVNRLQRALELLAAGGSFGVVLLDLPSADTQRLDAVARIRATAADVPIVVLAGTDDDMLALAAFQRGAQDWLAKDDLDGRLLERTLRRAAQRKRVEVALRREIREVEAARSRIEQQAVELRARAEQVDAVNRDLDDFTYMASHDLKEPLRGISGYCEILLEDYRDRLDPDGVRRLEALTGMCDRLAKQIENLLAYYRVGRTHDVDTDVDLEEVAAEQLDTLGATIDQRRASVEIAGRLPAAKGDPTLFGMVLANLISNSLKYNESKPPRVQLGAVAGEPCTIYVRDNGIGIDPKYHDAIFTIFRRLHGRKQYEGTGAGLTIVRKIVQSYGGRIWLESEPGQGSTFYFTLPPATKRVPSGPNAPHWIARDAVGVARP
ncbi:MAG: ATP-binding protein [Planctomycetia bacterium]|nr:ATP-binding protein [Planctomycetia bacterium]